MRTIASLLALLLVASGSTALPSMDAGENPVQGNAEATTRYAPHPSIIINGNEGPTGFITGHDEETGEPIYRPGSGVRSGSGTATDPYVIANWTIEQAGPHGILIHNTSVHVRIESVFIPGHESRITGLLSCTIHSVDECSGSKGIYLSETENIVVRNLRVGNQDDAMFIDESANVSIDGALIGGLHLAKDVVPVLDVNFGIRLSDSRYITINNVTFESTARPMRVERTEDVRIVRVLRTDGPEAPFHLEDVQNLTVERSVFGQTIFYTVGYAHGLNFLKNSFTHAQNLLDFEFEIGDYRDFVICGNHFADTTGYAVTLREVDGVRIIGNAFVNTTYGASVQLSKDTKIEQNIFRAIYRNLRSGGVAYEIHNNSFLPSEDGTQILGRKINATNNWWGNATGPSGDGPGEGEALEIRTSDVDFDPWLTSPPATGPDSVDCGVDTTGDPGATPTPVTASASAHVHTDVHVNEKAGPLHVKAKDEREAGLAVGPVPLLP